MSGCRNSDVRGLSAPAVSLAASRTGQAMFEKVQRGSLNDEEQSDAPSYGPKLMFD